jgi:hypothetical protein
MTTHSEIDLDALREWADSDDPRAPYIAFPNDRATREAAEAVWPLMVKSKHLASKASLVIGGAISEIRTALHDIENQI